MMMKVKGIRIIRDSDNVSLNFIDVEVIINGIEYSFRVYTSDTRDKNVLRLIAGVM